MGAVNLLIINQVMVKQWGGGVAPGVSNGSSEEIGNLGSIFSHSRGAEKKTTSIGKPIVNKLDTVLMVETCSSVGSKAKHMSFFLHFLFLQNYLHQSIFVHSFLKVCN